MVFSLTETARQVVTEPRLINWLGSYNNLTRTKTYSPEFIQNKSNEHWIFVSQPTSSPSNLTGSQGNSGIRQMGMTNNFQLLSSAYFL